MPNIIAHRGANKYAPQNTIPAFKKARELGCDGFENDTHYTKDRKIVVCHNYDVDATSNGTGKIKDMTFDELRALDFGSYFSEEFAGTQIPTLDEFFECCHGLKVINVEIKTPLDGDRTIVDGTIACAKEHGLFDQLLISSFDPECVKRAKEVDPECKTAILYDFVSPTVAEISKGPADYALALGCCAIHPVYLMVSEELVEDCHSKGIMVNPWTVDDDEAIKELARIGCDGLITNVCDKAKALLGL